MRVVTADEMREIDRRTIEDWGIPSLTLMENAGRAMTDEITRVFAPRRVAVVTGKGNNAGDGFVTARMLSEQKIEVIVCLLAPGSELKGDALENFKRMPPEIQRIDISDAEQLEEILERDFDCVVDAILGTGVRGPVTGLFAGAIEEINACGAPVAAVDIPSGLPADGGEAQGPVVRAALTVTMGLPKLGMVAGPSANLVEDLVIADIGFPEDLMEAEGSRIHLTMAEQTAGLLPRRPRDGHKGTFGRVFIIAGSRGMTGAAVLTAHGASRSGAGLVYAACPANIEPTLERHLIEPLKVPIPSRDGWRFDTQSQNGLLEACQNVDAVALGPGLGTAPPTRALVAALCRHVDKPMVIDADGLNCLAGQTNVLRMRPAPTVITPHPGELARLLPATTDEIQSDRIASARRAAEEFDCVVALKGAGTVVATPDGYAYINSSGNDGMAKGGSGDVLTGLIAGLLAQGMRAADAARAGVFIHGLAGDIAAREGHPRAMTAMDIVGCLGKAFEEILG
ncbi:MAG: NAD(P)H-hydrate dehydratase [Candidatus Sumerlaeota bacterium]|nr:NAD(P)H-hydrate dehydratase [Candidatus Sumerlaeota bacterium]